jgi:excisionase family DNA binding protein
MARTLITTAAAAEKMGVTQRYIQDLCQAGRIPQASRVGRDWLLPATFRILEVRRGRPPKNDPPKNG